MADHTPTDPSHRQPTPAAALANQDRFGAPLPAPLTSFVGREREVRAVVELAILTASCPRLSALVTSRELLRLSGERVVPVEPLALPDPARTGSLPLLTVTDAVALFRRTRPSHPPRLRLDGLPPTMTSRPCSLAAIARCSLSRRRSASRPASTMVGKASTAASRRGHGGRASGLPTGV